MMTRELKGAAASNVTTITIEGNIHITGSAASLFSNYTGITSLDVSNFDTSAVTNMSNMFYNCYKLTSLNITKLNGRFLDRPALLHIGDFIGTGRCQYLVADLKKTA